MKSRSAFDRPRLPNRYCLIHPYSYFEFPPISNSMEQLNQTEDIVEQRVEISSGVLCGLEATIVRPVGGQRLEIKIDGFPKGCSIQIDEVALKPLS